MNTKPREPHTTSSAASAKIGTRQRRSSGCLTGTCAGAVVGAGAEAGRPTRDIDTDCGADGKMPVIYCPGWPATGILTIRAGPVVLLSSCLISGKVHVFDTEAAAAGGEMV